MDALPGGADLAPAFARPVRGDPAPARGRRLGPLGRGGGGVPRPHRRPDRAAGAPHGRVRHRRRALARRRARGGRPPRGGGVPPPPPPPPQPPPPPGPRGAPPPPPPRRA